MEEGPSRAERRDQSRHRQRRLFLGIGAGVLAIVVIVVVVLLAGGGGNNESKPRATHKVAGTNLTLTLGDVSADSAGPPAQVTPEQADAMLKTIRDYITIATVDPLHTGKPASDFSSVFEPAALASVDANRAVVADEGLPKVTGDLDVAAPPVGIVALADQNGNVVFATAKVDLDITGGTAVKGTPLHIVRSADFVLAPDASGAWKITEYNIAVTRAGAGLDPGTTSAATATTRKSK